MLKIELFNDEAVRNGSSERVTRAFDRYTAFARMSPSFFIIGAQKAGTTSLYYHLIQHPLLARPKRKEIFFFNNALYYQQGMNAYRANFPMKLPLFTSGKQTFEATTTYLESEECPMRIKKEFPDAKFIVMLRNPVQRAYSHYRMSVKLGFEKATFAEAVEQEEERIIYGANADHNYHLQRLGYVSKGKYALQLEKWLAVFDRKNFFFIELNQWRQDAPRIFAEVQSFLNLSPYQPTSFQRMNQGEKSEPADPKVFEKLNSFYIEHNARLYDLLEINYNW
ncbi:MAG: sulfotransferase domain-containing protein [Flavobacteriales bacterium]